MYKNVSYKKVNTNSAPKKKTKKRILIFLIQAQEMTGNIILWKNTLCTTL